MTSADDLNSNAQGGMRATTSVMLALALISFSLRCCSILTERTRRLGLDDLFVTIATVLYIGECACMFLWIEAGLGRHIQLVSNEEIATIRKLVFALCFFYDIGLACAKFSVLSFYYRIFGKSNTVFYWLVLVVGFLNLSWVLSTIFSLIFECTPVRAAYEDVPGARCLPLGKIYVSSCIISTIVDVFIVTMPVPMLVRLQASKNRRAFVTMIFVCAYCVIITSIGRLVTIAEIFKVLLDDSTWTYVPYMKWAQSELALSIICCSLPNILSFGRRLHSEGFLATFTGKAVYSLETSQANSQKRHSFKKIQNDANSASLQHYSIQKEETFTVELEPIGTAESEERRALRSPFT